MASKRWRAEWTEVRATAGRLSCSAERMRGAQGGLQDRVEPLPFQKYARLSFVLLIFGATYVITTFVPHLRCYW